MLLLLLYTLRICPSPPLPPRLTCQGSLDPWTIPSTRRPSPQKGGGGSIPDVDLPGTRVVGFLQGGRGWAGVCKQGTSARPPSHTWMGPGPHSGGRRLEVTVPTVDITAYSSISFSFPSIAVCADIWGKPMYYNHSDNNTKKPIVIIPTRTKILEVRVREKEKNSKEKRSSPAHVTPTLTHSGVFSFPSSPTTHHSLPPPNPMPTSKTPPSLPACVPLTDEISVMPAVALLAPPVP